MTIARAQSLAFKLYSSEADNHPVKMDIDREAFIASLLEKPEVNVVGGSRGPIGHVIRNLFAKQEVGGVFIRELKYSISTVYIRMKKNEDSIYIYLVHTCF